jgi:sugar/nucleoside kinase (ribokinase family)
MKTIAIYGNFVIDNVFQTDTILDSTDTIQCSDYYEELGGLMNVARCLSYKYRVLGCGAISPIHRPFVLEKFASIGATPILQITDKHTSVASIVVCPKTSEKRTAITWGSCLEYKPLACQADWHHISYLDALPKLDESFLASCRGVISADLCMNQYSDNDRERLLNYMSQIDYVFMSDHEANVFFDDDLFNVAKTATIIHSNRGSVTLCDEGTIEHKHELIPNVNILGAGDRFAAHCIDSLMNDCSLNKAVATAHSRFSC